jgi:hypothetical protein
MTRQPVDRLAPATPAADTPVSPCVTKRDRLRNQQHERFDNQRRYMAGALPLYNRLRISKTSDRNRESELISSAIFSQPCSTVV